MKKLVLKPNKDEIRFTERILSPNPLSSLYTEQLRIEKREILLKAKVKSINKGINQTIKRVTK